MSDEVSDFLRSVEALKGRREEEDETRSRELEEKILQEKAERQARRAERARSISPQKSSPVNTPQSASQRTRVAQPASESTEANASDPATLSSSENPHPQLLPSAFSRTMDGHIEYSNSSSPTKENDSPFDSDTKRASPALTSPSSGIPPSRSPLSWQRRPTSQASDRPKSRPLSVFAAENAVARSTPTLPDTTSPTEQTLSRDQIAQSLAGRDPSWFRQTADRGQNSAAYRRSQVENQDTLDMSAMHTQLPGLGRGSAVTESPISNTGSRPSSPAVQNKLGSPLPLTSAQRLDPPEGDGFGEALQEAQTPASHDGRSSPARPVSPTKGMGGFVQSAMMKRSDSVKRWSVTSPAGLQRADTITSNRSSVDNSQRPGSARPVSRPSSQLRDGSKTPTSRPSSSARQEASNPSGAVEESARAEGKEQDKMTPPSSPSKTMDPRRWSPTKSSSWLEAALNKQESPKAKPAPATTNQPAWMVELNKAKAQKANSGSVDLGRASSAANRKHEVKTGGLMRSTPMGTTAKPGAVGGEFPKVPTSDQVPVSSFRANLSKTTPKATSEEPEANSELRRGSVGSFRANLSKTTPKATSEEPEAKTELRRGSLGDALVANRIKPETPPKNDFRANLKPRAPTGESSSSGQPEDLKNVLGNLRRTRTQNYVAPDIFKNNIMSGKAALNITGGPKPSERKDEFKDAILKKKEEFKKAQQEGRGVTRSMSGSSEKVIPEGLAKKMELGRPDAFAKRDSTMSSTSSEAPLKSPPLRSPPPQVSETRGSSVISAISKRDSTDSMAQKAPILSPKPASILERSSPSPTSTTPVTAAANGASARVIGKAAGGGLAARFNPALAGLLARGPPGAGSGPPGNSGPSGGASNGLGGGNSTGEPAGPGPQLNHMTKNRARGPRRKAPTSVGKSTLDPKEESAAAGTLPEPRSSPKPEITPETEIPKPASQQENTPVASPKSETVSLVDSRKSIIEDRPQSIGQKISLIDSSKRLSEEQPKPQGSTISFNDSSTVKTRPRSPTKVYEQVAALAAKSQQSSKPVETKDEGVVSPPSSPKKLDMKRMSRFMDEPEQTSPKPGPEKARVPSPTKSRPLPDFPLSPKKPAVEETNEKVDSEPVVSVKNGAAFFGGSGLGIVATAPEPIKPKSPVNVTAPEAEQPRSPPKGARPLPVPPDTAKEPSRTTSPIRSPTKYGLEISAMLTEFFGPERPKRNYDVDAAEILMRRPSTGAKIQTQQAQVFQISGDGKKVPVPAHHERVLFEREMYLCPHTFLNSAGKKVVEVYFWAGDEVPESSFEHAHVFVQKEARSLGGKLVPLRQGKETPEFLQVLGGIVIVRRGSSNKYDSLAPNMLCGRRYLGQVAFDEVDFSPSSLCSGFPYLVTQAGKCYLWKGKGSDVDELGCARLIGMDLALMGELVEVEDGDEPSSFWDIFDGAAKPSCAEHWKLKPNYDKYCGRLFWSNPANKQQIIELSPFSQADLLPTHIYILDAFFELYIVVGARSQHQYTAFRNALDFAQEYAILAAGMEDRPFVPISTVVLEGIPRDLKSVFRKWNDGASPTVMNPNNPTSPSVKRGRSLRIVPLNQALQALTE